MKDMMNYRTQLKISIVTILMYFKNLKECCQLFLTILMHYFNTLNSKGMLSIEKSRRVNLPICLTGITIFIYSDELCVKDYSI